MMKFLIVVKRNSVICFTEDELSNVHYHAVVDGLSYAYQIIQARESFNKPVDDWFYRGGQYVHYHAKNHGHNVQWLKVTQELKSKANNKSIREVQKWQSNYPKD